MRTRAVENAASARVAGCSGCSSWLVGREVGAQAEKPGDDLGPEPARRVEPGAAGDVGELRCHRAQAEGPDEGGIEVGHATRLPLVRPGVLTSGSPRALEQPGELGPRQRVGRPERRGRAGEDAAAGDEGDGAPRPPVGRGRGRGGPRNDREAAEGEHEASHPPSVGAVAGPA